MEMSVREARAKFCEVARAAARGERVLITKRGQPLIEFIPYRGVTSDGEDKSRTAK